MKILFIGQIRNAPLENSSPGAINSVAASRGHQIVERISENPDVVICYNWNSQSNAVLRSARTLEIPAILVKSEPSIVTPEHMSAKIDALFSRVVDLGRPYSSPVIKYPQVWNLDFFDNPKKRLDRVVSISANKFSFVPGELYSLRARSYSEFDSVDVFGPGWDRRVFRNVLKLAKELEIAVVGGCRRLNLDCLKTLNVRPHNALGRAENKLETLSRYKVSLVIENSAEYMSEKLLDSIFAGTIPVYVGPPVEAFEIPEGLVISADANISSIRAALLQATHIRHQDWHNLARKWLTTPGVRESWEAGRAMTTVLEVAESEI